MNRHRRPAVDFANRININDLLNSERALKNIKGRATFEEASLSKHELLNIHDFSKSMPIEH